MALTFSTPAGRLLSTKVGLDDVIATYSAAKAVYGWMGGMDGIKFLMSKIPSPFSHQLREIKLDRNLQLLPISCCILSGGGLVLAHMDNAQESFGGDIRTQLIGSTICALAHECSPRIAVELFVECLMPHFFDTSGSLTDALRDQLMTETNLKLILNEGAARGLNDLFIQRISQLGLPLVNSFWSRSQLHQEESSSELVHESLLIGGMLKWIAQDRPSEYRTRSASVARVAACLQSIGYSIGHIEKWDGVEPPPQAMAAKSLILVLGGSTLTDPLLMEPFPTLTGISIIHYQYKTVGSLLLSALSGTTQAYPEVFQSHFEKIYNYIKIHLDVSLQYSDLANPLKVIFAWKTFSNGASPIARRLAAIYFPRSADFVAACFDSLDNEVSLEAITTSFDAELLDDVCVPEELSLFRVINASIAISIASRFAPKDFAAIRHSSQLDLCFPNWLRQVCRVIDQAQGGTIELNKVIGVLAAVHAGSNPVSIEVSDGGIIAWREGIYAIVPSLLLSMDLNGDTLQLQCIDRFWANVKVNKDGSIKTDAASAALYKIQFIEDSLAGVDSAYALQCLNQPWLGPPDKTAPDVAMYLSIGTPPHFGGIDLCFNARIDGTIVGSVGIVDVLRTLLLSQSIDAADQEQCTVHANLLPRQAVNVKLSWWSQDRYLKPVARRDYTYVSVKGDSCWAIFLAGQTAFSRGRVVFGCLECITSETKAPAVLIGFR